MATQVRRSPGSGSPVASDAGGVVAGTGLPGRTAAVSGGRIGSASGVEASHAAGTAGGLAVGVIGATGRVGGLITREALGRGHVVTAFVRCPDRLAPAAVRVVARDVLSITRADVADLDVVVSAYGVPVSREREHLDVTRHLRRLVADTSIRLIMVGSAGHLFTDESRTTRFWETEMPEGPLREGARTLERSYLLLREGTDCHWSYLAPPVDFVKTGARTGRYRASGDVVLRDTEGRSTLSYADYAMAVVDEVESGAHDRRLWTVAAVLTSGPVTGSGSDMEEGSPT